MRVGLSVFVVCVTSLVNAKPTTQSPVPKPPDIQVAQTAPRAVRETFPLAKYVVRVECPTLGVGGSGFIHTSGKIITAAHVVASCPVELVQVRLGERLVKVKRATSDGYLDLALLDPREKLDGGLRLSDGKEVSVGDTVVTWGFPVGYFGTQPLVTVGYLSGVGIVPEPPKPVRRAYINGSFNSGNSGGPLIDVQSLTVVGVVQAKVTPIPPDVAAALVFLQAQNFGLMHSTKLPDGREISFSEAQVVGRVLAYLQQQTQLGISLSVLPDDLNAFLAGKGVQP